MAAATSGSDSGADVASMTKLAKLKRSSDDISSRVADGGAAV